MVQYSENQKKIALLLLHGPRTVEELNNQLSIPYQNLLQELKQLLQLRVVEKQSGFPTRYALLSSITEEVQRRKKVSTTKETKLRLRATIELQAVESSLLKQQAMRIEEELKKDEDFVIHQITHASTMKTEEMYSTFIDLELSLVNFKALVRFMYFFGPSTVEILAPSKIEWAPHDFQEGLLDMAQMIQRYAFYITKLMNRQELEDLNRRLIKK